MTIFRTDFTVSVVTMFVILSFVKIFHWLVQVSGGLVRVCVLGGGVGWGLSACL